HTHHIVKDWWLFDTGSTVHICNDKALFKELQTPSTGLGVILTGGGPMKPQGIGTVKIMVLSGYKENKPVYTDMILLKTLYIPDFPLNIVSGHKLYKSGGILSKQTLFSANRKPLGLLNFSKSGFFFN